MVLFSITLEGLTSEQVVELRDILLEMYPVEVKKEQYIPGYVPPVLAPFYPRPWGGVDYTYPGDIWCGNYSDSAYTFTLSCSTG